LPLHEILPEGKMGERSSGGVLVTNKDQERILDAPGDRR
jgi:hypothetical protein